MIGKVNSDRILHILQSASRLCISTDVRLLGSPVKRLTSLNGISNAKATHKIGSLINQLGAALQIAQ
jgi:hypothetical protein